jgi:hypothetical protein
MKKITKILMLLSIVSLFAVASAQAQIVVHARLYAHERARPPRPARGQVWVYGEWQPRGNTYVHVDGHWAAPPRQNSYWIKGYWQHRRHGGRGYFWVPGHWSGT